MAYFSNSDEGMRFDSQCSICKFGIECCPIWGAQALFNYKAVGNEVATKILNMLVDDDGTCNMYNLSPSDFNKTIHEEEIKE